MVEAAVQLLDARKTPETRRPGVLTPGTVATLSARCCALNRPCVCVCVCVCVYVLLGRRLLLLARLARNYSLAHRARNLVYGPV
jgi:hypothetical protein